MICVFKRQTESYDSSYVMEYEFKYDDFENFNNYDDVKNKFINFTLDEEYEDELKDEGYESLSNILFYLRYVNDCTFLFSASIEITDDNPIYTFHFKENDFEDFYSFLSEYKDKDLHIFMKMTSRFYSQRVLHEEFMSDNNEEETDDEEIQIPAIIENSFSSNNCSICLINEPNILNIPCLHLAACEECEKIGRFINCSICRRKIKRKVKI